MKGLAKGGRFIVMGVPAVLDSATRKTIKEIQPGGFILFGRNIGLPPIPDSLGEVGVPGSPEKLRAFIDELRSLVDHEPVICIDQEGGRVSRLRGLEGGAEPPSARSLAEKGDVALIEEHGRLTGRLLRLFGFNLDLCPVLDIAYDLNANNSVLNRCYGQTPKEVQRNAGVFLRALRAEKILTCGKHFPGYTHARIDPHIELPTITLSRHVLEENDWLPYTQLFNDLDFIMTAHAFFPQLDPENLPTSLSSAIITQLLREELGFQGWVMSDDLDMGAVTNHVKLEDSVQLAVQAGSDLILLCHDVGRVKTAATAIAQLPASVLKASEMRWELLRNKLAKPATFTAKEFRAINKDIQSLRDQTMGKGSPPFTGGSGQIGSIEAARLSPVNVVGDKSIGAPAEYKAPKKKKSG